ncbi:hypothetical protein [Tengunoibacter tsumagoiensis]|uniref:Uncharacterized protein n=1 Tax=Tengunoibacter tsumagoiensis TaxID=2014871 RepID=A0A402AAC9_9CHLR|nr:hypothetical protein [Tengunoibacter tsumagoiensis]GCE16132.1 hypothetical protein KTT_59910 [Tengunoibacter tsumagoiensis]
MTKPPEQRDDQSAALLREDETRCVRLLAACRRFAVSLSGAAGYYATFGQNEEPLLRSFAQVREAHSSPDGRYDQLFQQRCQKAGLMPSDVKRLTERLQDLEEDES